MLLTRFIVIDVILPLVLFPSLTVLAFVLIFGHVDKSGLGDDLASQCLPGGLYRIEYTSINLLNEILCPLVTVFHRGMSPSVQPFTIYFLLACCPPLVAFLAIEACRKKTRNPIKYPLIFGAAYQMASLGGTFPLYWLSFTLTGAHKRSRSEGAENTKIRQGDAESVIFGLLVGWVIPTIGMFVLEDPIVTALWQPVPLWASLAQAAHSFFRPASRVSQSGHQTVVALYVGLFIVAASLHLATVYPRLQDLEALKSLFVPSVAILERSASIEVRVRDLLQWDTAFGIGSALLGTLWFARTLKQLTGLLAWYAIAIPVVGPGAAFAGTALWRESYLNGSVETTGDAKVKTR